MCKILREELKVLSSLVRICLAVVGVYHELPGCVTNKRVCLISVSFPNIFGDHDESKGVSYYIF